MKVLFVSALIVLIDQVAKLYVRGLSFPLLNINFGGLVPGKRIHLLGEFFNITLVENPGIAFGIDFGIKYKLLLSLFTIFATAGLIIYLYLNRHRAINFRMAFALIIGGAMGNLIDRVFYGAAYGYSSLFYGKVVDFFELNLFDFYIFNKTLGNYVFNIADIAVSVGVIWLMFAAKKSAVIEPGTEFNKKLAVENKD